MADEITSGGTLSSDGIDVQAKAARTAAFYKANPPTPSGLSPTKAVVLSADDDIASATGKALSMNATESDADALSAVGGSWAAIRSRIDGISNDKALSPEGRKEKLGGVYTEAIALVGQLRQDATAAESTADQLEDRVEQELTAYDDLGPEERRALYDALMKLPPETVGKAFVSLAERLGELQDFEGARLVAILKLSRAGALPNLPTYHADRAWAALLSKSPHRVHVEAARGRAQLMRQMAGSVEAATMRRARETGNLDQLREEMGLDRPQPGRVGKPDGVEALVLDIPPSERDLRRWQGGRV